MRALVAIVAVLPIALAPELARAQGAEVPALIKLIDTQPSDMDRSTWKEKRRDAARKLAQSKDKRALPVLAKLADTETFDIIGEIAIEGLGTLGDPGAIPILQKIVGDPSRDKGQRDLARKSLDKLGASAEATPPPSPAQPAPTLGPARAPAPAPAPPPSGEGLLATHAPPAVTPIALPEVEDDTLAAYERITFAGGTASFGYDTLRKRMDFDADVSGLFQKRVERETFAWGIDVGANVVAGWINPDGRAQSRVTQVVATGDGEARLYSGKLYGIGKAAVAMQLNYTSEMDPNDPMNDFKETRFLGDFEVAVGAGYGRVLDVGAAIRVRRLARALDANRALGKAIDAATQKKLELTWWALRGERTTYRALVETVAILREAGVLLSEPDAGLSYEILNVLRDTNLYQRPLGFDLQLAFGEGYLDRAGSDMNVTYPMAAESGRVEQLLALAGYGIQLDDDKLELFGSAYGRLRMFAPDMQPAPWAAGATATMRRFTYAEHGDRLGIFDLTGAAQISNDDLMQSDTALRISGELGFTYLINQASGLRLAGQFAEDGGNLFIGAKLQVTYGLLDGTYAR
jgi:hypothetical protein